MILAVLQARMSSSRLPGKTLKPILGKPMLMLELERILRSEKINKLVVATSINTEDDLIAEISQKMSVVCFRGNLNDVLDRFYKAAQPYAPEHVVRLTGDCPLIDPEVIDATIDFYLQEGCEYASNCQPPYTFPDGLDTEVFSFSALETAWKEAILPSQREHVTPFIRKYPERFRIGHYMNNVSLGHLRWTVDEAKDFEFVTKVYEALYPVNSAFTTGDILQLLERNPALTRINNDIGRNEGTKKSLGEDKIFLAQRAA
ncbi:MAG: hypothetical protein UX17_C0077G0004 [Parcubacteria group bacterium GW2011_GWC2_45_7]|nr:MAG: hypothetical protein UX17_C0077G0004 [Parcubacteria group bacterium GW2011_GWC2_45_7]KKU74159.1 MAG: hypothetical protein UX98_C0001G0089 [Parcubacteria group bacterium GW2011_GWA2_47_26]